MAYTQSDLDAINAAIASGELRVRQGDREVEYRSMNDLIRAKGLIAQELAQSPATRCTLATFGRS